MVLRRYHKGEVICRQGEAGWTAFYILTSEDVLEVLRYQLKAAPDMLTKRALIKEIALQFQRVRQFKDKERADEWRTAALHPEPENLGRAERLELVQALNDLIKNPHLPEHRAFREILRNLRFRQRARALLKHREDWSEAEARRFNRMLLETVLAGIRGQHLHPTGPECTLGYCSRGDLLGEIGLLAHEPRSATCTAYGQRVELMRISETLFAELLQYSAEIRRKLQDEAARREKRTQDQLRPRWFEHSRFNHDSHRQLQCGACHGHVAERRHTQDVLMPRSEVCHQCHKPQVGVRAQCVDCHR